MPPRERPMRTPAYTRLQKDIWDALPRKKHMAGREKVNDVIDLVVQEWPEDEFAQADRDSKIGICLKLNKAVKRQMTFLYAADEEFESLWIIVLNLLVSAIIRLVLEWWLNNKRNRATMRRWRKKWRDDGKD